AGKSLHSLVGITLPNPEKSKWAVQPWSVSGAMTDSEGRYAFSVGPGEFQLSGPDQIKPVKFTVTDQARMEVDFNDPRKDQGVLNGLVVMGTPPTPATGASVYGVYHAFSSGQEVSAKTDANGRFEAVRNQHRLVLCARSDDGKLACIAEIGPEDAQVK